MNTVMNTAAEAVDAAYRVLHAEPELEKLCTRAVAGIPTYSVRGAVVCHLAAPATPARSLAADLGVELDVMRAAYQHCRHSKAVKELVGSWFYPHRLRTAAGAAMVRGWLRDPQRPARILAREPVLSETVEIHPTRGTCNYRCAMCLWSDQQQLTYTTKGMAGGGLMTVANWRRVLYQLHEQGARRIVVSGGGEALINPELPGVLNTAYELGFKIDVYTTGFSVRAGSELFSALLRTDRIRLSIHSPDPATYDQVAGTRPEQRALPRVTANLAAIRACRIGSSPKIGIGFVLQPANHEQISAMVKFAEAHGADWLDLRKDEVDVTDGLTGPQLELVREQLRALRRRPAGSTRVDIGDELVSLANGQVPDRSRTPECLARYFRPTIGPYGQLAPCDLKAEPRFADTRFDLGSVKTLPVAEVLAGSARREIPDRCDQCMPSSRTGNAIMHKLLDDLNADVALEDQPF